VHRALTQTYGNYRATVKLLGMPEDDYKRFLNFLDAHGCRVDYRPFRKGNVPALARGVRVASHPASDAPARTSTDAVPSGDEQPSPSGVHPARVGSHSAETSS
jgi:hypothetical protein